MAQTFDEQLRRVLDTVAERLRQDLDTHLTATAQQLSEAVDAERAEAAAHAARDASASTERDVTARLASEFATREAEREAEVRAAAYGAGVEAGLQQARVELTQQLRSLEAERSALNTSVEARMAELTQAADARIAEAESAAAARVAEAASAAELRASSLAQDLQAADARIAETSQFADAVVAEARQAADARVAEADARVTEAAAAAEARVAEAAASADARAAEAVSAAEARAADALRAADTRALLQLQAALDAMRTLDRASSLSEALDALAQAARSEADRVALFLVREGTLRSWMRAGFDGEGEPQPLELALDQAGLIGDAVRLRSTRSTHAPSLVPGHETARPAFAERGVCAAATAVPVVMHGKAIAVMYAELTSDAADPARLTLFCELLARHAARLLESLTVARLAQFGTAPAATTAAFGQ